MKILLDTNARLALLRGHADVARRVRDAPLPTNDIWIATHAMESGAELVSFDGHFADVDGLAWVQPPEA